jgi:hypothetical protein
VERHFKPLNWLSALDRGEEQRRPHFLQGAAIDPVARTARNATVDRKLDAELRREAAKPSFNFKLEVRAESCQRAFDQARKDYPDALYEELSEIAAKELHIPARRLRKLVPNPFR